MTYLAVYPESLPFHDRDVSILYTNPSGLRTEMLAFVLSNTEIHVQFPSSLWCRQFVWDWNVDGHGTIFFDGLEMLVQCIGRGIYYIWKPFVGIECYGWLCIRWIKLKLGLFVEEFFISSMSFTVYHHVVVGIVTSYCFLCIMFYYPKSSV